MKRLFPVIAVLVVSMFLVSCTAKTPKQTSSSSSQGQNSSAVSKANVTYSKEFTYFPSYAGLQLNSFTAATKKAPFATARYTIKNTTDTKVYNGYMSLLKSDGWTITKGQKYFAITAKKGSHFAEVVIQPAAKNILLLVISK